MNLTFAQPAYFLLLIVLPVLIILKLVADARQRTLVRRAAAARLLPRLVHRRQPWRDWTAVAFELIALGLLITALARPQLGMVEEEIVTSGRSVMLALDTSRSMLVEDLRPNRLTRTKLVMNDLIVKLPTDRIGLIAFAGKPFLQAPVTQDHDALLETLEQCDTEIIPRGGSNLAEAIDLAISTFKGANLPPGKTMESLSAEEKALLEKSQATSQALIIFSDGEELEGTALAAAQRAKDAGVTIISVGVGTAKGGVIPNPDTKGRDYMRDEKGTLVMSGLNKEILEQVASVTRGLYLPLDEVVNDSRLNLILSKLDASTNKNKMLKKAVERYQWPLAGSLFFLLVAVCVRILRRRPAGLPMAAPAAAALALLAAPLPSQGAVDTAALASYESALQDLQMRPSGSPEHLAWQRLGEGAVAYTNGDFDKALEKFGKALLGNDPALRTQAHFNLGNSFYARAKFSASKAKNSDPEFLGHLINQLQDCISNYQATLTLNPQHKEAAGNKKIAEDLLKKLKEQKEQQEEQKGDKKDKKDKGDKGEEGDKEKGDQGEKGEQPGESNPGQEKGDKGEGSGEPQSPGEEPSEEEGAGKEGDQPKDSGEGNQKEEGDKGEKPDERTEAQKEQEKAAQEESNKERDGKVEAMKNQQGEKPGEKPGESKQGDERKNEKTGFSRAEARRNLEHFSDDVKMRQMMETARPDRPFKNW